MEKKITLFFLLSSLIAPAFGQTVINDFESGSPTNYEKFGATLAIVANPNTTGNTTANVAKIGRTTANWYEGISFDLASAYVIPAGVTKYCHVWVNFAAQADIGARFDVTDANTFGGSTTLRATNLYTDFGQWQDMVFAVEGGAAGLTVNAILFHADIGVLNEPAGRNLNNTDTFGYVDEFTFSDNPEATLKINNNRLNTNVLLCPNPTTDSFVVNASLGTTIIEILIYNTLGKNITSTVTKKNKNTYDVSSLKPGVYMVVLKDDNGNVINEKLLINN
ncbi:T9SS type A sorting domain-containing protein [Flavicella sediminum]|uniref:T9SS type A sorting domain-containing protein n=1 Tax=Flavicella sediminum TaxID=2585141 RepID=UPI00111E1CEE|nr:T9SS type A sorting domain-containing protein [Flavicella sediminum]